MTKFVFKQRSWFRYLAITLLWCFVGILTFTDAHGVIQPHLMWLGVGGTLVIWIICIPLRSSARRGVINSIDQAIAEQRGGHVRGSELVALDHLTALLEAIQRGFSGHDVYRQAHVMMVRPDKFPRDPHIFDGWVKLAGMPIPPAVENLHFAIAASTGAGKSVTLRGLLADIRQRGDRAIVIDNGSEFMEVFGRDDDLVLSPFDSRSRGWNVVNEIRAAHDWSRLARSVVPDGHGSDKSWHEMAQTLFANIGAAVGGDNRQLLDIATSYTAKMLEPILTGTSSAVLTQEGGERLLTNIRSVYATHLASWRFMQEGDFSLRDYMQGTDKRWLFVPFLESEFSASRPLIRTWMDILVSAGLERPEGSQQTWIIIDELDTLGAMSSLIAATTKLRKRKVSVVVAFQSISQLEQHYGRENAETLLNCFSSKVILRSVDGNTAERLSRELGERERWKKSYTVTGVGGSTTQAQHVERLVLPSQIQSLPDLHGYIKLAGNYPVARCKASVEASDPKRREVA